MCRKLAIFLVSYNIDERRYFEILNLFLYLFSFWSLSRTADVIFVGMRDLKKAVNCQQDNPKDVLFKCNNHHLIRNLALSNRSP